MPRTNDFLRAILFNFGKVWASLSVRVWRGFGNIYQLKLTNVPSFFGPSIFHRFLSFLEGFWEGFGRVWKGFGKGLGRVWGGFGKVLGGFLVIFGWIFERDGEESE